MAGDKKGRIYYSMGEVAEMFDVNPSLIRFWEQKFDILRPKKNKKGNRLFTPEDVENLKLIYHLVKENGMTLAGAQKRLKANKAGAKRDQEIIDRLYSIRSLLMEIGQELKIGADEPAYPDAEPEMPATAKLRENDADDMPVVDEIYETSELPREDDERSDDALIPEDDADGLPAAEQESEQEREDEIFADADVMQDDASEDISPDDYRTNIAVAALSPDDGAACACDDAADVMDSETAPEDDLFASLSENTDAIPTLESALPLQGVETADAIIDGGDIDPEYIAMLSEQAALAAEVMDTIAEMDGRRKDDDAPQIVEQTLF